ncbi:methyltransferase family protein [Murinocardiopsis flavida]|uniref:Methyltransferase family protein n=1 Tax=Murinocardiopsis flavida TaxID=645275 RepID=A0A2P8DKM2_9ACTN|nr:class I SAM-dependent methyltransferase [Murinocardiopsis flavida]PSK97777.1 methyltransferase family protein [Murinocardiopsis flavida]
MASPDPDAALRAYAEIAPYYNAFAADPDYGAWMGLLHGIVQRHGPAGKLLLDAGCGTGLSSVRFADLGYAVTGVDAVPEMLDQARADPANEGIDFRHGDLRDLPAFGAFDVAVCTNQPLHYMDGEQGLRAAFAGLARNLAPGGILVFDMLTARTWERQAAGPKVRDRGANITLWRTEIGAAFPATSPVRQNMDLFVRRADGAWTRVSTVHPYHHFPDRAVRAALAESGFEPLGADGFRAGAAHEGLDEEHDVLGLYAARRV